MLDKKQIQPIFLFKFKMVHKLATSTMHLAQEPLMTMQRSSGSRSFAKETRALKMRYIVASSWKLTTTNWEHHHLCRSSYNYTRSCPRTQHRPFCGWLAFETNRKGEKTHASWADQTGKKIIFLKFCLLLFYTTMNHFSIGLWCATKRWIYTITSDDQLSSWTKKFQSMFQSQTCTKRGCGLCLVVRCQSDPLQLSESQVKPLQLRSMLGKLMRCTKNCNACSWHWSTERAQFFSMTIPDATLHNQHFKSWINWPRNCCLIFHICLVFC